MCKVMLAILANFHWICFGVFTLIQIAYVKSKKDDYWLD